jgi:hypothetical protein
MIGGQLGGAMLNIAELRMLMDVPAPGDQLGSIAFARASMSGPSALCAAAGPASASPRTAAPHPDPPASRRSRHLAPPTLSALPRSA